MSEALLWLQGDEFLLAGGRTVGPHDRATNRCFLLRPTKATPTFVEVCPLSIARSGHTTTRLDDGRVVVIGGYAVGEVEGDGVLRHRATRSAEIYCPVSNTWRSLPPMREPRVDHSAVRLQDGRVIVIGGLDQATEGGWRLDGCQFHRPLSTTEILDIDTGTWEAGPTLPRPRHSHCALLMSDHSVGVFGGLPGYGGWALPCKVEAPIAWRVPESGWTALPLEGTPRARGHTATLLPDARVMLIGGEVPDARWGLAETGSVETLDPSATGWFRHTECKARANHSTTLLSDGRIVVIGGECHSKLLRSVEIFDPRMAAWTCLEDLECPRSRHVVAVLSSHTLLVCGGQTGGRWFEEVEIP